VSLAALLASGYFFAELPPLSAALLAFGPTLALTTHRMSLSITTFALRLGLVSVPVAVALILAFRSSPPLDY